MAEDDWLKAAGKGLEDFFRETKDELDNIVKGLGQALGDLLDKLNIFGRIEKNLDKADEALKGTERLLSRGEIVIERSERLLDEMEAIVNTLKNFPEEVKKDILGKFSKAAEAAEKLVQGIKNEIVEKWNKLIEPLKEAAQEVKRILDIIKGAAQKLRELQEKYDPRRFPRWLQLWK